MVPPLPRFPEARELIDQKGYFVLHAPRQTGKTTTLRALAEALTAEGRYAALHVTCEEASTAGHDYGAAMRALLDALRNGREAPPPCRARAAAVPGGAGRAAPRRRAAARGRAPARGRSCSSSTRSTRWSATRSSACSASSAPASPSGRRTSPGRSSSAGCATCATTSSPRAAARRGSARRAPSTSR